MEKTSGLSRQRTPCSKTGRRRAMDSEYRVCP
ncbi:hypothetical protein FFLO_06182 [Filobasidium floriforme]|uniref:Uncharacterized protein n=1 Tax=Filobasidium floriforme TaxID=5210 RepID=A0A8K0JL21_9TREE|nr:hypothetical protein FFLO_06182 [Filobasidium floriforme]